MGMDKINARNLLRLTYYLILQERIDEAFKIFKRIDTKEVIGDENKSEKIQYDYINAYLDFCLGYPKFEIASEICTKYKNFPLLSWREKFEEIENQLFEFNGKEIVSMSNIEIIQINSQILSTSYKIYLDKKSLYFFSFKI